MQIYKFTVYHTVPKKLQVEGIKLHELSLNIYSNIFPIYPEAYCWHTES